MKRLHYTFGPTLVMLLLCGIWLSTAIAVAYATPQSSDAEEKMKQLIVMVTGHFESDETIGAGIIFGLDHDTLYIMTANHVVRRGERAVKNLRVEFKFLPDKRIEARLLPDVDKDLDLAVLSVVGLQEQEISTDKISFELLGNSNAMNRGDFVYLVGYPNGNPWLVNVEPDKISEIVGESALYFESNFVTQGHSGGGLFDNRGALVGMIRKDQPPRGEAVSIKNTLDVLKSWGYAVSLKPSKAKRTLRKPSGGGKKWLWIGLGTTALGGGAIAIWGSGDKKTSNPPTNEKLPDPPGGPR